MAVESYFTEPLILLGAAIIAVPLFKRLGLGSVLGYLAAGLFVGPVLSFIADGEEILHFAELGVVLFLFIIGLELKPSRLWRMRRDIFGLGAAQMLSSGLLLGIAMLIMMSLFVGTDSFFEQWQIALIVGLGLALSSTAIVMQVLEEKGEIYQVHGQRSFSILLFQDLAIVPLLALVAFLSPYNTSQAETANWLVALQQVGKVAVAVLVLVVAGRYLLNPIFHALARSKVRELMTALALLIVLGAAALMQYVGLSTALGAFLAGVMLAESSFRHELEADIEPFRGLLLGLFFMAIGMSINANVIFENWQIILLCAPLFMALKAVAIYTVARIFGTAHSNAIKIASLLPQHGEFGFVLFAAAVTAGIFEQNLSSILTAIVAVTMALTPLSLFVGSKLVPKQDEDEMEMDFSDATGKIIMVGFGRFGQLVAQFLLAENVDVTIIDNNADSIRNAEKFGFKVYFGDGTRMEVLRAAGLAETKLIIFASGSRAQMVHRIAPIRKAAADIQIFVRSSDRLDAIEYRKAKVDFEIREVAESAYKMGASVLHALGFESERVDDISIDIRRRDEERLAMQVEGDIQSGSDNLHRNMVVPAPLRTPARQAERLNKVES